MSENKYLEKLEDDLRKELIIHFTKNGPIPPDDIIKIFSFKWYTKESGSQDINLSVTNCHQLKKNEPLPGTFMLKDNSGWVTLGDQIGNFLGNISDAFDYELPAIVLDAVDFSRPCLPVRVGQRYLDPFGKSRLVTSFQPENKGSIFFDGDIASYYDCFSTQLKLISEPEENQCLANEVNKDNFPMSEEIKNKSILSPPAVFTTPERLFNIENTIQLVGLLFY